MNVCLSFYSCFILISLLPKTALGDCSRFSEECLECTDSVCNKCKPHYILGHNKDYCYPCAESCLDCKYEAYDDPLQEYCTSCNPNYYLKKKKNDDTYGKCIPCESDLCDLCVEDSSGYRCTKCKSGYYLNNNECESCYETCDTCNGPGELQCLTCKDGFFDQSNSEGEHPCTGCAELCKKCHGADIADCDECNDGYFFSGNECKQCDSECGTCAHSSTYCTSCKDGFYLDGNNCYDCHDTCKTCSGPGQYKCTSCGDGFALVYNYCESCLSQGCVTCKYNSGIHCIGTGCAPGYRVQESDSDLDPETFVCQQCEDSKCISCDDNARVCTRCQPGYVVLDGSCHECTSPCKICHTDQKTCDDCVDGYYLDGNSCKNCPDNCKKCDKTGQKCTICNDGFYLSGVTCEPCDKSCQTCHDNTNKCDTCKTGYYFDKDYKCQPCSQNCVDCNLTTCFQCSLDFYPDGKSCSPCASVCSECKGPTADDCTQCDDGYYISGYGTNRVCMKCDDACKTCQGSHDNCRSCASGYFKEDYGKCKSCEFNCIECDSMTECTKCKEGFRLYQREGETDHDCQPCKDRGCKHCDSATDKCTECIDGFYPTTIEGTNFVTCSKCHEGCKKCDKSSCSECSEGFFKSGSGSCIKCSSPCATCSSETHCSSCAEGYLFDGVSSCNTKCAPNCMTCEGNSYTCTSCFNGYGLRGTRCETCTQNCRTCELSYNGQMTCTSCKSGYYMYVDQYNPDNVRCEKCNPACKTCTSYDTCSSCAEGYYFTQLDQEPGQHYTGKCSSCSGEGHEHCLLCIENCNDDQLTCSQTPICTKCSDGYYIDEKSECQSCDKSCNGCTGGTNKDCIKCVEGFFQSSEGCVGCSDTCLTCGSASDECTSCKPGFFLDGTKCTQCQSPCTECKDKADYCTKCANNQYSYKGGCYSSCSQAGEGLGVNVTAKECYECKPLEGCLEMNDGCQCNKCQDGYFITKDPQTRFDYCLKCNLDKCKACSSTDRYDCTECIEGYYVYSFPNSDAKECRKCESPCTTCTSQTVCSNCIEGYFVNSSSNCQQCEAPCTACSGKDGKTCSKCQDGFYLKSDQCATCHEYCIKCTGGSNTECSACSAGYFFDGDHTCSKCTSPCLECTAQSPKECTSCIDNYYLSGKECLQCEAPCLNCKGSKTTCTSCQDGYSLDGSTCKPCPTGCKTCTGSPATCQTCIDGYYHATDKCIKCDEGCATCEGSGSNCQTCTGGYYHEGTGCHKCAWPCLNCTGPTNNTCQSCITGFVFNETTSSCDVSPNACPSGQHCDFTNNEGESKNFTTDLPKYEGIDNPTGNGGALKLVNYGFVGIDSEFTNCNAPSGGGGAIFIFNSIQKSEGKEITQTILLQGLKFTSCKAKYGAAVYIYSESENSPVQILSCQFKSNQVISSGSGALKGGSALYLTVKEGKVNNCIFSENKGEGGAVKVSDDFAQKPEMLSNFSQGLIEFSGCTFNIEKNSDCSLFYVNNKRSTKVQINNCEFTGQLAKGAHFIDGQSIQKEMPNLFINSCKFATDENGALNSKFIKVDLGNQVLSQKGLSKKQFTPKMLATLSMIAAAALIIIVSTVIIIKRNGNDGASSREISQESIEA